MKKILTIALFGVLLFLSGCSSDSNKFGFKSQDCEQIFRECMRDCSKTDKTRNECLSSCQKSRSMCEAFKVKGCMQKCNERYEKGSVLAKRCIERCKR